MAYKQLFHVFAEILFPNEYTSKRNNIYEYMYNFKKKSFINNALALSCIFNCYLLTY